MIYEEISLSYIFSGEFHKENIHIGIQTVLSVWIHIVFSLVFFLV